MRALWHPRAIILILLVVLLVAGGKCLHDYSETTQVFVPRQSNSTLVMNPDDERDGVLGATNATRQYRFFLDVNATLYFGVFELNNPASVSTWDCNITGHPIFETRSAEFNETLSIGPGSYAYLMCNRGREMASGKFQYSVLTTFVTKPRYSVGSFLYIAAGLLSVWGLCLLPEALSPKNKSAEYSRFLRWTMVAPAVLLFASMCLAGAISAGANTDVPPLILASIIIIVTHPEMLVVTLHPVMLLLCFLALIVTVAASLVAYMLRIWSKMRHLAKSHRRRWPRTMLSQLDLLSQRCANIVLPDAPHVGAFVRLGIVSLFTAEVITMSPWEFVRTLHPYLNLPPWILPLDTSIAKLSLESLILPMAMTIFGLFAYSLTWRPRSSTAFRAIGTIYSMLFFLSLLLVLNHLVSQDYLMSLVTRFMAILPLTLVSAYLAWMAEILIRRILIHRTLLRISQIL